jgi:universal stress protein F
MKRILVGLDGSPQQASVLTGAVELARSAGGKLTLFRAVGMPVDLPTGALTMPPDEIGKLLLEAARRDLERIAASTPVELIDHLRVELATPWRGIVDAAAAERTDLVVIGAHGHSGFDRILGTTAAKVVDHACCSVLVIRPTLP